MSNLLKPKGVYWEHLSSAEKKDIQIQIPKLQSDPNYVNYRYYKSQRFNWIICNAMVTPMKTNSMKRILTVE